MSKKCLVYETLNNVKDLKVENSNGLMTLSGVFGVCGVRNNNHRVYEKKNYESCVNELKARIKEHGSVPGELEHPEGMNITLENISHKITDINISEDGVVSGTIQLLNTPKGKIAQSIVEGGLPLFVSSRATGTVDKGGNVTLESLSTYDLVGTPGFSQAKMHLNESLENIDNVYVLTINEDNDNNMNGNNIPEELREHLRKVHESYIRKRADILEKKMAKAREVIKEQYNRYISNKVNEGSKKPEIPQELREYLRNALNKQVKMNEACQTLKEQHNRHIDNKVNEGSKNPEIPQALREHLRNSYKKIMESRKEGNKDIFKAEGLTLESFTKRLEEYIELRISEARFETINVIKEYVNNDYSKSIEKWLNEHFEGNKSTSMDEIKSMLTMLEGLETPKPTLGRVLENGNEPAFIANMPIQYRPLYEAASAETKDMIAKRSRLYSFHNEDAINKFWESVKWDTQAPSNAEGLQAIREQFRLRKRTL